MEENDTNVFGITEPENYRCHIVAFVDDKPSILIVAHKTNPETNQPHFFGFQRGTLLGRFSVVGRANSQVGSYDEMMTVLAKWFVWNPTLEILNHPFFLLPDSEIREDHLQRHFKLYKVKSLQGVKSGLLREKPK